MSFCVGCGTGSGSNEIDDVPGTFDQNPTFDLGLHGGQLYAGTESGLFRKPADPSVTNWESLGLGNATIRTFLIFSETELLASAAFDNPDKNTIAKTTDGGQGWFQFQNSYSGGLNNRVPQAMDIHPNNSDILFAGGPGGLDVAKSSNHGNSWELILGTWENLGFFGFLKIDEKNPQNIWAGGSGAIFRSVLSKSVDGGQTWQDVSPTGAETNVNDLTIRQNSSNSVLLGMGIGIYRSLDGGITWRTVMENIGAYTFTHSARDPETIYASGQNPAGSLFFVQSDDFGDSWQQVTVPGAPSGIRANDMISVMTDGREVLYFATNKGVYKYSFEK